MNPGLFQIRALEPIDAALLLLLAGSAAAFAWSVLCGPGTPRAKAFALGPRAGACLLLVFVLFQPLRERRVRQKDAPVAVVFDGSASMAVRDGDADGSTRWAAAQRAWAGAAPVIGRRFAARAFLLDNGLHFLQAEKKDAPPKGAASDFSRLEDLKREFPGVRAVVFFTDGRHGGGPDPRPAFGALAVPVHAVAVGRPDPAPDLLIASLNAPRFAFKDTDVTVVVRVQANGFRPGPFTARLICEGRVVAERAVAFIEGQAIIEVPLAFRPDRSGPRAYEVRLPVHDQETNRDNNRRAFSIDVARDRVRVLYISGRPGPNHAFLRHQLKSDPSVELVSFLILRDPEDAVSVSDAELSLIPFPSQDALLGQLPSFDVVILEDFSFAHFGIGPAALQALRDRVLRGGGLLLMGEADAFSRGGPYAAPLFKDVLPESAAAAVPGPARYAWRPLALDHPLLALADDAEASRALWARLPVLEGHGRFLSSAETPFAAPLAASEPGGHPLLYAARRGQGRVMLLASLTTWRWSLAAAGRGLGAWPYQRFWSQALRWLASAEDFRLVRFLPPETPAAGPGETAVLRAIVRDERHQPLPDADVHLLLESPAGARRSVALKSLGGGEYAENLPLEERGLYRATVTARHRGKQLGRDQGAFRAGAAWDEGQDTSTDFAALAALAASTGGDIVPLKDMTASWLEQKLDPAAWSVTKRSNLWHSPAVWAGLLALLFADWIRRRRRGEP